MRSLLFLLIILFLYVQPLWAYSYGTNVEMGVGSGLITEGAWDSSTLEWKVEYLNGQNKWLYTYTFNAGSSPDISHIDIQVSENFYDVDEAEGYIPSDEHTFNIDFSEWKSSGFSNPEDFPFPGLKWEGSGIEDNQSVTLTITTPRDPMWGNFLAKGGQSLAYNSGFNGYEGVEYINLSALLIHDLNWDEYEGWGTPDNPYPYLLVPDTTIFNGGTIPEPGTFVLMACAFGLFGLYRARKKRVH